MEYAKFEKKGLNNRVSLSHSNILQRPHQWAHFRTRKHLDATFPGTLLHTYPRSVAFYPNPKIISLMSASMDVRRATSIWTIMMNPRDIEMKDISDVFFDTVCDKHEIPECTKKPA